MKKTVRTNELREEPLNPAYKIAFGALVLFAVGFAAWQVFYQRSDVDEGLTALRVAYRNQRPVEARISGFDYAPLVATPGGERGAISHADASRAQRLLFDAVHHRPGADSHHALGQLYLAQREFDKAIAEFNEALKTTPRNAFLHNDLGAALLEMAKTAPPEGGDESFETLAESLKHLEEALTLGSDLPTALFNKALCLQQMMVPGQAREAWQSYLRADPESPWVEEARRNLRQLGEQQSVAQTPAQVLESFMAAYRHQDEQQAWQVVSRNREMITGKMIPLHLIKKLAEARDQGRREEAAAVLPALIYAGWLEKEKTGDPYFEELARYYVSIGHDKYALLAEAQAEMTAGYALCQEAQYGEALEHFLRARGLFAKAGDALEVKLVDYWIAYCYCQTDKIHESLKLFNALADYSRKSNYKWLLSQALCWIANCYDLLGDHSRSIAYDQQALALAEALEDTYNQQKILTQIGLQYTRLGRPRQALAYNRRSLALSLEGPTSQRQTWRNLTFTSQTFYALKRYEAAAAYEREALQLGSDELKDPTLIHISHIHLAMIFAGRQLYDAARAHLDASLLVARAARDELARQRMIAYSTLQFAHLKRLSKDYGEALELYNSALELYSKMEFDLDTYDAHKGRLLSYLAVGHDPGIQAEMDKVMGLFEKYRALILEEQNRNSFFDSEHSVYDLAVDYAFSKRNYAQAFKYSEESRSRSLLDSLRRGTMSATNSKQDWESSGVTRPLDLPAVQTNLRPGVQIVQYNALKDRLLIWVISATRFEVVEKKISSGELNSLVLEYARLITRAEQTRDGEVAPAAKSLYEILVSPVEHLLDASREVCVIPDKALSYLPFATLVSPSTNEYLLRRYTLLFSPSASVLIFCSKEAGRRAVGGGETFLGVGNPTFDRVRYPHLQDLPSARTEVMSAARNYDDPHCLVGPDALKKSVEARMERANVLHFACHYVTDEMSPMNSKLLLAKGDAAHGDGTLSAHEVSAKRLRQARLVVLSACQTSHEGYYDGEGTIGISRTFLAAGAPLVVASQWPVETEAAAELMINFHRFRKERKLPTTSALRLAQLQMLDGPDERRRHPFYWAAFLAVGGHAGY